jgi:glycosyltransferase involved in cell wall biosynthesis
MRPGRAAVRERISTITHLSAPRKIAFNAMFLDPGVSGGTETYLRGLAPALANRHPDVDFVVVTTRRGARALRCELWSEAVELVVLPADDGQRVRRFWAEQGRIPYLARKRGWDLVHSVATTAPIRCGVPSVITLHDVTFFRHRTFGALTTAALRVTVKRAARNADVLITGAAAARDEICRVLKLDPAKFVVVHHGHDHRTTAPADEETVRSRHQLEGRRVLLCVGAKRPHKNQEVLIRAMGLLGPDTVLVLAGHPEPYDARLRAIAVEEDVVDRVRFVDYVPDAELESLYRMASCAAFPSVSEGFGIPVVEAMQRGVPVVASDIPVLREVGGDAPRFFDPRSAAEAAEAIREALGDPSIGARGPARAARFTWDRAARGTFEAYERAFRR